MRLPRGLVALGALAVMIPSGTAAASTGSAIDTPGQAGYAVTGAHFIYAASWVRLPDASKFASELGRLSVTVQFWNSALVLDLTATACTDMTCRPGGTPVTRKYRLRFAVYKRSTGALVCSTAATGQARCPAVPRSWNTARIAPGHIVPIYLDCPTPYRDIYASVGRYQYMYDHPPRNMFGQARIGLQFGTDPWSRAAFRAPRTALPVASFGRPPSPPSAAEISTVNGFAGGFIGFFSRHEVRMTGGKPTPYVEALPGRLRDGGYRFTVYLEPRQ